MPRLTKREQERLARIRAAIGEINAKGIDADEHARGVLELIPIPARRAPLRLRQKGVPA